jgi:hypothetical protein
VHHVGFTILICYDARTVTILICYDARTVTILIYYDARTVTILIYYGMMHGQQNIKYLSAIKFAVLASRMECY